MKVAGIQKLLFLFVGYVIFMLLSLTCLAGAQQKAWNLSDENLFFVGREEHLQSIHDFFNKGERRILALTGGSGFGKSQIAKKFTLQFAKDYDLIWWFDAKQDLPSQFEKLTVALNTLLPKNERIISSTMSKEVLIDMVKNVLSLKPITYLFIFDNAEDYDKISKFIPSAPQSFRKNIILTSRSASIWPDTVEIGKFKREESLHFIKGTLPQANKEEMIKLAEILVDYPLELTIALHFIKSHPTVTINKYLSMYIKKTRHKNKRPSSALLDHYPHASLGALEISLKDIEKESKDSLEALYFISLLNSKDIPETYIELWLKMTNSLLTSDEAIKHIYDQSLLGVSETTEFNADKKSGGQQDMHYLSMHDLIHQLINENISVEEKRQYIDQAAKVMLEIFAGPAEVFTQQVIKEPVHLLHAQKLCENAKAIGYVSPNLLKLKVCIFECLMGPSRNFENAKTYFEEIENDLKTKLDLEPYYKALFKINKGYFECIYNVNYDEAIRNMKEGLTLLEGFKEYNEDKLRAIANLAQYSTFRGETDRAEEFINKGKETLNKSQSAVHNFFIFVWSFVLIDKGKFKESAQILSQLKTLPTLYPALEHGLLRQKLETALKLGKLKEASKLSKEHEKQIQEFFQGRNDVGLGNVLLYKSLISIYNKEKIFEVFNNLNKALEIYQKSFHGDKKHRHQARVYMALGKAHFINQEFKEALKAYLLSEEIYDIVLKEKKIDDVSDLYSELAILGATLKDEEMAQKYLNTHIETFGLDHPRTEKILQYLDRSSLGI